MTAPGLDLRPLASDDANLLLALRVRNREQFRHTEPARSEWWYTLQAQVDALATLERARADGRREQFGIWLGGGELVGLVSLSCIERGAWHSCNLAYSIDHTHWGRGFATQPVAGAVRYAFDVLGLHRVQAATLPDNHASACVLEKNGFGEEGFAPDYLSLDGAWRDHRIFARTAEV